jgi:DNA-binding transcriptional ArsR family regulator
MNDRADGEELARIAGAMADASRATMLLGMLDGRAWTPTELARVAGVARSTATEHVDVLASAGLIESRHQGRHRYVRLADTRTAMLLEMLQSGTVPTAPEPSWRSVDADAALRAARTCYDHLAGALGVGIHGSFVELGFLAPDSPSLLSPAGQRWVESFGLDPDALGRSRRPLVLLCLDWTERRDHLAGALGAALLDRFLGLGWVTRHPDSRAVRVTEAGRAGFDAELGLVLPSLPPKH